MTLFIGIASTPMSLLSASPCTRSIVTFQEYEFFYLTTYLRQARPELYKVSLMSLVNGQKYLVCYTYYFSTATAATTCFAYLLISIIIT